MLNLRLEISKSSSAAAALGSGFSANRVYSQPSFARKESSLPLHTPWFFGNGAMIGLKDSQSKVAKLQILSDKMLGVEGALRQIEGDTDAPQAKQFVAEMKSLIGNDKTSILSSHSSWTSALDNALVQMEGALENLGASFADSVSPMSTLNPNSAAGGTDSSNADDLSAALQSVTEARSVIDASAVSLFQSSLDTMANKLIENIDNASGSLDFNIEQTLLQAGNDALRDRSTISALVSYLLQP
ncbi:hypothetical protein D0T25_31870 [Duganella sp. BJB488]|uniref:hypothetical protein n=1 Tax=unclassified Duganella TaxID=2636909 RepID=UPI000ED82D3B|nr:MULTISPECIES: hypothetical protein [unclassified Duganella]RFP10932.1 hypothetical protein D0T25_31870 [Duganella sp. BJB488]